MDNEETREPLDDLKQLRAVAAQAYLDGDLRRYAELASHSSD